MPQNPPIQIFHSCRCGWKRYITNTPAWFWKQIDHPLYGQISQLEAAELDVTSHFCPEYRKALARSPRERAPVKIKYPLMRRKVNLDIALGGKRAVST